MTVIYHVKDMKAVFHLRYNWTGWLSGTVTTPAVLEHLWETVGPEWEKDGLRLVEPHWSADRIQIVYSTPPDVNPVWLAQRAKGRLQHAMRNLGWPHKFTRKLALRSIGDNTREQVEHYIRSQVE